MSIPRQMVSTGDVGITIKLFGINGYFVDSTITENPIAVAFGGYFLWDKGSQRITNGQLIDIYGSSTISGEMDNETLIFNKKYPKMSIPYHFKKQNGFWVGEYEHPKLKRVEPAKSITNLVEKDDFIIICGKKISF
jgi:hypothetical protein